MAGLRGRVLDRPPGLRADHRPGRRQTADGAHRHRNAVPWPATAARTKPKLATMLRTAVHARLYILSIILRIHNRRPSRRTTWSGSIRVSRSAGGARLTYSAGPGRWVC